MSGHHTPYELPPEKQAALKRAVRLEWTTIAFMLSIIAAIGFTMGGSETMKAVWTEDALSLLPPTAFLVGTHYRDKPATAQFPYGYRRAILIAYLCSALALCAFGLYILSDSLLKLFMAEHPTIGTVELFGQRMWLGWLMMVALAYSAVPPFILGRMKLPLARELHEKTLQTDANLNKGDWLTGLAGIVGIAGIGYGYWWADAVAAGIISFEIIKDGLSNLRNSIAQLMNKRPSDVESKEKDPAIHRVQAALEGLDWVKEVRVRLREDGDALTGEAFIVPRDERQLLARMQEATEVANSQDWRLHDINIVPLRSLE
jgi:cation diffusion facilitator family transporter